MTDTNHPITPPPELMEQWECEYHHMTYGPDLSIFISEKAARWGADQELEACCEWMASETPQPYINALRAARRPKPPSLKERALQAWAAVETGTDDQTAMAVIRRALEALPE